MHACTPVACTIQLDNFDPRPTCRHAGSILLDDAHTPVRGPAHTSSAPLTPQPAWQSMSAQPASPLPSPQNPQTLPEEGVLPGESPLLPEGPSTLPEGPSVPPDQPMMVPPSIPEGHSTFSQEPSSFSGDPTTEPPAPTGEPTTLPGQPTTPPEGPSTLSGDATPSGHPREGDASPATGSGFEPPHESHPTRSQPRGFVRCCVRLLSRGTAPQGAVLLARLPTHAPEHSQSLQTMFKSSAIRAEGHGEPRELANAVVLARHQANQGGHSGQTGVQNGGCGVVGVVTSEVPRQGARSVHALAVCAEEGLAGQHARGAERAGRMRREAPVWVVAQQSSLLFAAVVWRLAD